MSFYEYSHLPRLEPEFYRGYAFVHWTYCIKNRMTGWLDEPFHFRFREALLHALHRHERCCPAFVLMPDHIHLLVVGLGEEADQLLLSKFLRKRLNQLLAPLSLQKEGRDNVLRDDEREQGAFQGVSYYILENPTRAGLVQKSSQYPFSGCIVPGYCDLDPRREGHWELFWRIYNRVRE